MVNNFKTLSKNIIYKNPYWDYFIDVYSLPSGKEFNYYYVETPGSTFIIPIDENNNFIMTKQYRYLNQKYSIEFPGGGKKINLSPIENAKNELTEETGFITENIYQIGEFNPFNGVTNEICKVFVAKNLIHFKQNPDETEQIEVLKLSYDQICKLISTNEIWDGMTLAAWSIFIYHKEQKNVF